MDFSSRSKKLPGVFLGRPLLQEHVEKQNENSRPTCNTSNLWAILAIEKLLSWFKLWHTAGGGGYHVFQPKDRFWKIHDLAGPFGDITKGRGYCLVRCKLRRGCGKEFWLAVWIKRKAIISRVYWKGYTIYSRVRHQHLLRKACVIKRWNKAVKHSNSWLSRKSNYKWKSSKMPYLEFCLL